MRNIASQMFLAAFLVCATLSTSYCALAQTPTTATQTAAQTTATTAVQTTTTTQIVNETNPSQVVEATTATQPTAQTSATAAPVQAAPLQAAPVQAAADQVTTATQTAPTTATVTIPTTGTLMLLPEGHPGSYPVVGIEGDRLVRRVDVAIDDFITTGPAPVVTVSGADRSESLTLDVKPYPQLYKRIHVPVWTNQAQLKLTVGEHTLAQRDLVVSQTLTHQVQFKADPPFDPTDADYILVPAHKVVVRPGSRVRVPVAFGWPGPQPTTVRLLAFIKDIRTSPTPPVESSRIDQTLTIPAFGVARVELMFDAAPLGPGEWPIELRWQAAGLPEQVLQGAVIVAGRVSDQKFGAVFTNLVYPEMLSFNPPTTYPQRFPHGGENWDVLVRMPNGSRLPFWRGANRCPGILTGDVLVQPEWVESGKGEPCNDAIGLYDRVIIRANSPARAVVSWRYPDHADRTLWAEETYTFYPDGFGTRKSVFWTQPGQIQSYLEVNELMAVAPAGLHTFDVFPEKALSLLRLDGRRFDVEFPVFPHSKHVHRYDNLPVHLLPVEAPEAVVTDAAFSPPVPAPQLEAARARAAAYKMHGGSWLTPDPTWVVVNLKGDRLRVAQMAHPAMPTGLGYTWGPHFANDKRQWAAAPCEEPVPLSPGWWTEYWVLNVGASMMGQVDWQRKTTLTSLAGLPTFPYEVKVGESGVHQVSSAWLLGSTGGDDRELIEIGQSWTAPAPLSVPTEGVRSLGYDPVERAYRLACDTQPTEIKISVAPTTGTAMVNPAFIIENWKVRDIGISVEGGEATKLAYESAAGFEEHGTARDAVVWVNRRFAGPGEIVLTGK